MTTTTARYNNDETGSDIIIISRRRPRYSTTGSSNASHHLVVTRAAILLLACLPLSTTAFVTAPFGTPQHGITIATNNAPDPVIATGGKRSSDAGRAGGRAGTGGATASTRLACQLLGINTARPTISEFVGSSWSDFCQRGGGTDVHADGWGLAYYNGRGRLRTIRDARPAFSSPLARRVFSGNAEQEEQQEEAPLQTSNLMAHIRYATAGEVNLDNVHPFSREMWGINWGFCHNGQVPLMIDHPDYWLGDVPEWGGQRSYAPTGQTDSEAVFCAILNALKAKFSDDTMPSLPVLYSTLQELCKQVVDYNPSETILNFLLTCGPHVLWVYSYPGKRPGSKVWNGLHYSIRSAKKQQQQKEDHHTPQCDCLNTMMQHPNDKEAAEEDTVCVVATKPLISGANADNDEEEWVELRKGELIVFDNGLPHVSPEELFRIELQGHGLSSSSANDSNKNGLKPARLEEDMRRYHVDKEFFAGQGI